MPKRAAQFLALATLIVACGRSPKCIALEDAVRAAVALRGLSYDTVPKCRLLNETDFESHIKALYAEDIVSGKLEHEGDALKMLGFLPDEFEYADCVPKDSLHNVSAFYDPRTTTVFLPDWKDTPSDTLVHEAVHAIQDTHYQLETLKRGTTGSTDSAMALAAVVEGDAVRVQEEYKKTSLFQPPRRIYKESNEKGKACPLPETLLHQYEFPYSSGLRFVQGALAQEGPAALEQWLRQPPKTSSEVLYHYSKRKGLLGFTPEIPDITVPQELEPQSWTVLDADTLGEYTIRTLIREYLRSTRAIDAALGWRGDRYKLFGKGETTPRLYLSWTTVWANETEAKQFFDAYREIWNQRSIQISSENAENSETQFNAQDQKKRRIHLKQQGNKVFFTSLEQSISN